MTSLPRARPYDAITPQPQPPMMASSPPVVLHLHKPQGGAGVQQQPCPAEFRTQGPGDHGGFQGTWGQSIKQAQVRGREEDLGGGQGTVTKHSMGGGNNSAPSTWGD